SRCCSTRGSSTRSSCRSSELRSAQVQEHSPLARLIWWGVAFRRCYNYIEDTVRTGGRMKQIILSAVVVALGASLASADEIQLANGRKITGKIAKKDSNKVVVEVGAGTITLDAKEVTAINPGATALDEYAKKWDAVKDSTNASDFLALAKWSQ